MRKIQGDYIFDGYKLHRNYILEIEHDGKIIVCRPIHSSDKDAEQYNGLIMPGFINTHCHLELSHLQNTVPTGTGLITFINSVVKFRDVDASKIDEAIETQDRIMWDNGIQAVGDICNKVDTLETKTKSSIKYYSFVEMFDMLVPGFTENTFNQYHEVYKQYNANNGNNYSAVPHAPYSVTKKLFQKINQLNIDSKTVSIHNQETPAENEYFQSGEGGFKDFFEMLKLPDNGFIAPQTASIYYAIEHMNSANKTLFVHNTTTTKQNILDAQAWNKGVYWATCPNANLYIENTLPDYKNFIETDAKVTIGTDSLTSNWQLSVLSELQTIQRYNSYIPIEKLLQWSTINGAEALSFDYDLGSFNAGKKPGIIQLDKFKGESLQESEVKRIV